MIYAVNKQTKEHRPLVTPSDHAGVDNDMAWRIVGADPDGWIPWHGGEQPLPDGHPVEIKKRKGRHSPSKADDYVWGDYLGWDRIVAYRPVLNDKPQWVPEVGEQYTNGHEEVVEVVAHWNDRAVYVEVETGDAGIDEYYNLSPLPTEEDQAVEEMYRDAQLADCVGFTQGMAQALYRAGYRKQKQSEEDMSDPANWRAGDLFKVVEGKRSFDEFESGTLVRKISNNNTRYEHLDGRDWWALNDYQVRFIRRP